MSIGSDRCPKHVSSSRRGALTTTSIGLTVPWSTRHRLSSQPHGAPAMAGARDRIDRTTEYANVTEAPVWRRLPSMDLTETREQLITFRKVANEEARSLKDSRLALERLQALYHGLTAAERELADKILMEWILSDDETVRFDALALVDRFKIRDAAPALSQLARRLGQSKAPSAIYELKKVDRVTAAIAAK